MTKFNTHHGGIRLCLVAAIYFMTGFAVESQGQSAQISSINNQSFPFVFLNVEVNDANGNPILDVPLSQFSVCENGVEQTGFFEVLPPNSGGGNRRADIVFIQDNSGSMGNEQAAIRQNLFNFVTQLENSDIDFALGLVRYGASGGGAPIIEESGNLTTDAAFFRDVVFARNNTGGGTEPGYQAIFEAASGINFRTAAQRIFVVITDETPNQSNISSQQATDIAVNNSVTVFALTEQGLFSTFNQVTMETNGAIFNITDNFDFILEAISTTVSSSYLVRYQSDQPTRNGMERTVEVKIDLPTGRVQDAVTYTPGAIPVINLAAPTKALFEQAFDPGTPLEIVTKVMDEREPFVQNVQLFYQNQGDATFQQLPMTQDAGTDNWRATIPQGFAQAPSVNFYIVASDGENSVTSPSEASDVNPFQIAILPNEAPVIEHTPIETADVNTDLAIAAKITDITQFVASANLFHRELGDIAFDTVAMVNDGNGNFTGTIPAAALTCAGTEYYIEATDDQNVSALSGTLDEPYFVTGTPCGGDPNPPGDCNVEVMMGPNNILVKGLDFKHNKAIVYTPDFAEIKGQVQYEDNFQGDKLFEGIPAGDYSILIQTFTDGFAEIKCDTIMNVTVTDEGVDPNFCTNLNLPKGAQCDDQNPATENDIVQDDCTCAGTSPNNGTCQVTAVAGAGSIAVNNLDFAHNKAIVYDRGFTTIFGEVNYPDNFQGNKVFENLAVGDYVVLVQTFTQDFAAIGCDLIIPVSVTEGGSNPPTTNLCSQISVSGSNGELQIGGLVAPIEIMDVFNKDYFNVFHCFDNCGDFVTISDLTPGRYFINLKSYTEEFRYNCDTIIDFELLTGANGRTGGEIGLEPRDFRLYPNPAEYETILDLNALKGQKVELIMYNNFGQKVWSTTRTDLKIAEEVIDLINLPNGLYHLYLQPEGQLPIGKNLIINRMY